MVEDKEEEEEEELGLVALHVVDVCFLVVIRVGVFWVRDDNDGAWSFGGLLDAMSMFEIEMVAIALWGEMVGAKLQTIVSTRLKILLS